MTKLWLDTEFNGFGGEFISAALIAEDGSFWYQAVNCNSPVPWAAQHIIPALGVTPVNLKTLQTSLQLYLSKYESITIVADWPTDIEHFCRLLSLHPSTGNILKTPPITFELKTNLNGKAQSAIPHNALEDARAIMVYDLLANT